MALLHASLCFLVLLATFSSQCTLGFGQTIGLIEYQYNAGAMTFQTEFLFLNGTFTFDAQAILPQDTNFVRPVPEGVQVALTQFNMQNSSGNYFQHTLTWSSVSSAELPFPCAPNCFWLADVHGFSLKDPATGGNPVFWLPWVVSE